MLGVFTLFLSGIFLKFMFTRKQFQQEYRYRPSLEKRSHQLIVDKVIDR